MASYPKSIHTDVIYSRDAIDLLLMVCKDGFTTRHATLYIDGQSDGKIRQILHYLADMGILEKRKTGLNSIYWQSTDAQREFIRLKHNDSRFNIVQFINDLARASTPTQ